MLKHLPTQTDREQIYKLVMHGEELLSRFRHWEPIISECLALPLSPLRLMHATLLVPTGPEVPGGTAYSINPSQPESLGVMVNYDKMDTLKKGDYL